MADMNSKDLLHLEKWIKNSSFDTEIDALISGIAELAHQKVVSARDVHLEKIASLHLETSSNTNDKKNPRENNHSLLFGTSIEEINQSLGNLEQRLGEISILSESLLGSFEALDALETIVDNMALEVAKAERSAKTAAGRMSLKQKSTQHSVSLGSGFAKSAGHLRPSKKWLKNWITEANAFSETLMKSDRNSATAESAKQDKNLSEFEDSVDSFSLPKNSVKTNSDDINSPLTMHVKIVHNAKNNS